jgi:hypothetical protein
MLSKYKGLVQPEGLRKMKKLNYLTGSRTRDLLACSIVLLPQCYCVPPILFSRPLVIWVLKHSKHFYPNGKNYFREAQCTSVNHELPSAVISSIYVSSDT